MKRREFMALSGSVLAGAAFSGLGHGAAQGEEGTYAPFKNAVQFNHIPKGLSAAEKFAWVKAVGFDGIEAPPFSSLDEATAMGALAKETGIPIHSIIFGGWRTPMSDPDPEVIAKGKKDIEHALQVAKACGAEALLLVPAVVNESVGYQEAWDRSYENIKSLLPTAESLGIVIAVENVWNKFLLSPIEFATYVDAFESPWLRSYFDLANIILYGYSQDWVRTLGKRIFKIHVKDFKRKGYEWSKLPYEGDVNWGETRKALEEVGFKGWATEEFPGGDDAHYKELSRRMTLFGQGAASL